MRRTLSLLLAATLVLLTAATAHAASPWGAPPNCTNGGTFIEAQAWWLDDTDPSAPPVTNTGDFGHGHLGICAPPRTQSLSGTQTFSYQMLHHDNPGDGVRLAIRSATDNGDGPEAGVNISQVCNVPGNCTFARDLAYNMTNFAFAGEQELRTKYHINEMPVGDLMLPVVRIPVNVQNGKTVNPYDTGQAAGYKGIGWYSCAGYQQTVLNSGLPAPVARGSNLNITATFNQFDSFETGDCARSNNITHWFISIDPDFHGTSHGGIPFPGVVVREGDTACAPRMKTRCNGPVKAPFSIPIPADLAPGTHKLMLRADAEDAPCATGPGCPRPARGVTGSGVLVVPFTVT